MKLMKGKRQTDLSDEGRAKMTRDFTLRWLAFVRPGASQSVVFLQSLKRDAERGIL